MDAQELVPLESGLPIPRPSHRCTYFPSKSCHKTPIRICRLLTLLIVLPSIILLVPLYLKYRVYSGQMYPMSMTDMRLIDSKISPTWCQRQVVKSNATFNAFVVPGPPELTEDLVPVSMTRHLDLEDDMKEYWGFYLLKGSSVTVSACVRWPGASLIMIKGYRHLQDCAYIGDDSSEELDELLEANKLGLLSNTTLIEKLRELNKEDGKANDPETMTRHKAGVSFHDPRHAVNGTLGDNVPAADITDHDPKELQEILERLHALRQAAKDEALKYYHPPSHLVQVPALHRHRDTNIDKDERRWFAFKDIDGNNSEQLNKSTDGANDSQEDSYQANNNLFRSVNRIKVNRTLRTSERPMTATTENAIQLNSNKKMTQITNDLKAETDFLNTKNNKLLDEKYSEEGIQKIGAADVASEKHDSQEPGSREVFEDVLKRLQGLGDRGKRVLVRLHQSMGFNYEEQPSSSKPDIMSAVQGSSEELDRLRKVLVEAIDEEKTRAQRQQKRRKAGEAARQKRELMLGQIELQKQLNEDDEARDYAAEEGLEPDGYAEHHVQLNETTPLDMSNSEFWSSFSSSEEALLECEGLILNLPLTPHSNCYADATKEQALGAAKANALTYRVPANGYYFFVFNSENEVQRNYIRARFDLQKTRYDVARTTLRECRNSTQRCDLALDIFSTQKVVLEVPLRDNDSLWNEQFVIISECEPRTSIYIACVVTVPLLILIFGFQ